ncbi:hypothetical protein RF11_10424 [Thelohanellus kitauei]|uniref:Tc1-like transposase DDE domain-containing protein n=1 Tax=Thelohanellus kitauei TaxID=669202 RepID=A0A0C2N697_THEKT|nr:hypothetical protein RF11_10424 [Thelohanellus kitauei]
MPRTYKHVTDDLPQDVIKLVIEEGKYQIPMINRIVRMYRNKGTAVDGKKGRHKLSSLNEELKLKLMETIKDDTIMFIDCIIKSNIIYLDESPFKLHMIKTHACGQKGKEANPVLQKNREQNITMIVALNFRNIISAEGFISTGVNSAIFKKFLTKLVEILGREGQFTILMDNSIFQSRRGMVFPNKSIVRRENITGTNDLI